MNDINNIRNSLGKLENEVKSSAPNASNSPSSESSNSGGQVIYFYVYVFLLS